jgi:hypothetical protein
MHGCLCVGACRSASLEALQCMACAALLDAMPTEGTACSKQCMLEQQQVGALVWVRLLRPGSCILMPMQWQAAPWHSALTGVRCLLTAAVLHSCPAISVPGPGASRRHLILLIAAVF